MGSANITIKIFRAGVALLLMAFAALTVTGQSATRTFSFPNRGGVSGTTTGDSPALRVGFARFAQSINTPAGFALFGLKQGNALVSEVTVPISNALSGGRIYAETGGGVDIGFALANENNESIPIVWYFTDSNGVQVSSSVFTIPAHGQISQFLSEAPFNIGAGFRGTFTFLTLIGRPDQTIGAIALRSFINERGEFLMTSLPIIPLDAYPLVSSGTIPHFASGGGWATQVILVNPTDAELGGRAAFFDQNGAPSIVDTESGSSASFDYKVAPRSSWSLKTLSGGALKVGSVKLGPSAAGIVLPVGFLVFSFAPSGTTVVTAGVPPARPANDSSIFVEAAGPLGEGQPGWIQTGIAISNVDSTSVVRVLLDLSTLDGAPSGFRGTVDIPAGGQIARFLNQVPGFESLPLTFQGVLRVSAPVPVATIGLRARYNERDEFLITTLPVANENDEYFRLVAQYSSFVFPHFVDGAGYTTQFVLFSGWTPGPASGTLEFLTNTGAPLSLTLRP